MAKPKPTRSVLVEGPMPSAESLKVDSDEQSPLEKVEADLAVAMSPSDEPAEPVAGEPAQEQKTTLVEPFADHPKFDKFK